MHDSIFMYFSSVDRWLDNQSWTICAIVNDIYNLHKYCVCCKNRWCASPKAHYLRGKAARKLRNPNNLNCSGHWSLKRGTNKSRSNKKRLPLACCWRLFYQRPLLGGGFKYFLFFHPYLGKMSNLTNMFQRGWNHQLDVVVLFYQRPFAVDRGPDGFSSLTRADHRTAGKWNISDEPRTKVLVGWVV